MKIEVFVEIRATETSRKLGGTYRTYRFYGRGVWQVKSGDGWKTINAIYVPAQVLRVAASQCVPTEPPRHPAVLTEREIARLCGGR